MISLAVDFFSDASSDRLEAQTQKKNRSWLHRSARDRRVQEHADRAEAAIELARESIEEIKKELNFPLSRGVRIEDDDEPASVDGT